MNPMRGIALKVISVTLFVSMAAMIKYVSEDIPSGQSVFFRSFFAIPVIFIWLLRTGDFPSGLGTKRPIGHLARGVLGTIAMALGFAGLAYLPLPEVTAIGYAAPLLTVLFAALFLGEKVRFFRTSCVLLGSVGVIVVIWPRLTLLDSNVGQREIIGVLIVLAGAIFTAFAQIMIRNLVTHEKTAAIVFWFSVTASLMSLSTIPMGWVIPSLDQAVMLIGAGLVGGAGQIFLTSAYRNADASLVAPFEYVSMLFAISFGWLFYDELPGIYVLFGTSIVIAAGILIILRERYLGLERTRQCKAKSGSI